MGPKGGASSPRDNVRGGVGRHGLGWTPSSLGETERPGRGRAARGRGPRRASDVPNPQHLAPRSGSSTPASVEEICRSLPSPPLLGSLP